MSEFSGHRVLSDPSIRRQADDLQRYMYLRSLQDRDESLFHAVLAHDVPAALQWGSASSRSTR